METVLSYQEILEEQIKNLNLPNSPKNLYDPLRYFMTLGGKRTRPTLTLMGCQLFGEPGIKALNAALAVELFHNFTLIHDDIMDDAPLRRGKTTVHEKWNTNIGILSGDVLFVEAYKFLAKNDLAVLPGLIDVFSRTAVEVCEGQQMDNVQIGEYIEMTRLKTSVLLGAALEMGAIVAKASEKDKRHLYNFGMNVGIAFQLQDDYLDLYADPEKFGKQVGGDVITNKKTFLLLKAFELANDAQLKELSAMIVEKDSVKKVAIAKALFVDIGVDKLAKNLMYDYYHKAKIEMASIDLPEENKQELIALGEYLINREI